MLREIDGCADFDTEEVHARIEFLTNNSPDSADEEEIFGLQNCGEGRPDVDVWRRSRLS
jgi:hypothetical protein